MIWRDGADDMQIIAPRELMAGWWYRWYANYSPAPPQIMAGVDVCVSGGESDLLLVIRATQGNDSAPFLKAWVKENKTWIDEKLLQKGLWAVTIVTLKERSVSLLRPLRHRDRDTRGHLVSRLSRDGGLRTRGHPEAVRARAQRRVQGSRPA